MRVELISVHVRPTRRRNLRIVEAAVRDDSGAATAIWFNQGFLARTLLPGSAAAAARHGARRARPRAGGARARGAGRGGGGAAHERHGGRLRRLAHALDARPARARRAAPAAHATRSPTRCRWACASAAACRCAATPSPRCMRRARPRTRRSRATAWPTRSSCCCRWRWPSGARTRPPRSRSGRPGELLERYHASLPVHAHDRAEAQHPRHRPRSRPRRARDAPPAAGRRRLGQDRRGGARDAARRGARRARRRCWRPPRCSCSSTPPRCAAWWSRSGSSWR